MSRIKSKNQVVGKKITIVKLNSLRCNLQVMFYHLPVRHFHKLGIAMVHKVAYIQLLNRKKIHYKVFRRHIPVFKCVRVLSNVPSVAKAVEQNLAEEAHGKIKIAVQILMEIKINRIAKQDQAINGKVIQGIIARTGYNLAFKELSRQIQLAVQITILHNIIEN